MDLHEPPRSGVADVLGTVLSAEQCAAMLALIGDSPGRPADVWRQLRSQPAFQEKAEQIQFAVQLGLLTGNNVPLISRILADPGLTSAQDLVRLDGASWAGLIAEAAAGDGADGAGPVPAGVGGRTAAERIRSYADGLAGAVRTALPSRTAAHLLAADTSLVADDEARAAVLGFLANCPDFDLRTSRVSRYTAEHADRAFAGLRAQDQALATAQLKRIQRAFQLAPGAETAAELLRRGLDSAHKIANTPRRGFLDQHGGALGGAGPAAAVYERAQSINARNLLIYTALNDVKNGISPRAIGGTGHAAQAAQLEAGLIKQVPDYAELFGAMDICQCDDCRSVLSPAAYLVDLLQFLAKSPARPAGQSVLDVLGGYRPDIVKIELTCENTNTTMPYIDLVNEILEGYVVNNGPAATANDTGDATGADLDANPQYTLSQAYVTLAGQLYPFTLPFNQPVAAARTYLRHLGSSRYEVISTFQPAPPAAAGLAADAEYLGITPEQLRLLTRTRPSPIPVTPLNQIYGYPDGTAGWESMLGQVPTFLARTGIGYEDLVQLVSTRFINPAYPQGADGKLFARLPLDYPALAALAPQFTPTDPGVLAALAGAGISTADFTAWCTRHYPAIGTLLVLDNPDGGCDLASTVLTHLGDTGAGLPHSTVNDTELDRFHRLIRLWRLLGWTIPDIDRTLSARGATSITAGLITDLARIKQLASSLGDPATQVLLAMWAPLDPWGPGSLYQTLFLDLATLPVDAAFQPGADGSVLTDGTQLISDHVPALLAALNVTSTDLALIRTATGLDAPTAALSGVPAGLPATASVSALYRFAALAQLLALPVADLITLRTLAGPQLDPFTSPESAVAFVAVVRAVQSSGFPPVLLNYLFRQVSAPPTGPAPQRGILLTLASLLRQGLAAIATQTSLTADPTGALTQATLTQLISKDVADQAMAMINGTAVYGTPLATLPTAIALVAGGQVAGIDPAKVPSEVAAKISYDPAAAVLRFTGAMTTAEQDALLGAVADPAFQAAVTDLAQQPLRFIAAALDGLVDPARAGSALVTSVPSLDADLNPVLVDANGDQVTDLSQAAGTEIAAKRAFVLAGALPYLARQLSHALAKQTMADALGVDPAAAAALLETMLVSPADPSQPAVADLLALGTPGLTAEYFTTPGLGSPTLIGPSGPSGPGGSAPLGGTATIVTVSAVGAADPGAAPGTAIPAGTQSARWQAWLLPPTTATYTFTVVSPGTTQLWVGDDSTPAGLTLTPDPATGALVSDGVALTAGQLTPLRLEVTGLPQPGPAGGTVVELLWQCPTIARAALPAANLMPAGIFGNFTLAYTRLQKAALLISAFGLSTAELSYLAAHPADFAGLDLNALPLTRDASSAAQIDQQAVGLFGWWQRLQAYVSLRDSLPGGQVSLIDVFAAPSVAAAQTLLAQATGWDPGLLADLIAGFGLAGRTANPMTNEVWPVTLRNCERIAAKTGASAAQLFSWARYDLAVPDLQAIGEDIKKAARAHYDPATWLTVAKPLSDVLRGAQRDALVSYVVPKAGLRDPDQLFELLLIDAEMGTCMETSRISQAISSVQLFVQRCLLNLEPDVSPAAIEASTWQQWMGHYAVWAANREVFLYPENWLVPSLRDDITPIFADIQGAVIQNQVTADNAEAAFLAYLQDLEQVARLDIRGVYWQDADPDTQQPIDTLHVFGRTFHAPRQYFYRCLLNARTTAQWTPWQQVPVDIQGDHLIPVVWNRRLRLLWPVFTEHALAQASGSVSYTSPTDKTAGSATSSPLPPKYWQITLAWSEYVQGTWQAKKVSDDFLISEITGPAGAVERPQSDHVFKARVEAGRDLVVDMLVTKPDGVDLVGEFRFSAFGTAVSVGYTAAQPAWPRPEDVTPSPHHDAVNQVTPAQLITPDNAGAYFNGLDQPVGTAGTQAVLDLPMWFSDDPEPLASDSWWRFLSATPTPFDIRFSHQYRQFQLAAPFFYQDRDRTFFAMAQWVTPNFLLAPDSIDLRPHLTGAGPAGATPGIGPIGEYELLLSTHRHPYVPELIKALARQGGAVSGLLNVASQALGNPYLGAPWTRAETLPDPVTGAAAMIQGDFGAAPDFDFEAVVLESAGLVHYYRSNSQPGTPWVKAEVISATATGCGSLIQSSNASNGHRQFEVIVPESAGLAHYTGQAAATVAGSARPAVTWSRKETLPVSGVIGPGSLIQSSTLNPDGQGRLEVVVLQGTSLIHIWWNGTAWQQGNTVSTQAAAPGALIQDSQDQLDIVVPQSAAAGAGPPWDLQHYYGVDGFWRGGAVISRAASGAPCLIQGDIRDGLQPNRELIVPEVGAGPASNLVHYWLDASVIWHLGQVVTTQAAGPGCLIQSSYGAGPGLANTDFEVLAFEGTSLVHYTHSNGGHVQWSDLYQPNAYHPVSNGGLGTGAPADPFIGQVLAPYPVEDIDFAATGAYSVYNWELFFHAPMLIATTLSQNQQFAAADTWFRYVFDPTNDAPGELAPQRYWKVAPFQTTPAESISALMAALDAGDAGAVAAVDNWRAHPFAPFSIARLRVTAFQRWVFMKYLDNLIAWGDSLFAQNTTESVNQATQLYVLASDLLGPRPELIPPRTTVPAQTFQQLQPKLDKFSNAMEQLENEFPFATQVPAPGPGADTAGLLGLSQTLFFGIPQNATMLGYWDTVADRLFKIRNCMNLQGVVEQLPLFQPIVNPALLVQAAAEGVDLGSVLNDLNAPPPVYRFPYLLSKAVELCADCRALGTALLAALEKGDAEGLALLRATQETQVLAAMETIKQDHITEQTEAVSSLQASRDLAWGRYTFYQTLLGAKPGAVPAIGAAIPAYAIPVQATTTDGGIQLLQEEEDELVHSHAALDAQLQASSYEIMASLSHYIPQGSIDALPFGIGGSIEYGGEHIGPALAAVGRWYGLASAAETYGASHAGKMAGYFRRWQEWALQSNLASGEIMRIDNDIAAASMRVTIATQELTVHQQQMAHARTVQDILTSKYTNQQLYLWMADQAAGLYFQLYQLAYGAAKQAERAFDTELGLAASSYIQFGYWDSLRKGLLAGERLQAGLRQLEQAYIGQNRREYEITRSISLLMYSPMALIALKEAGQCVVEFPEALFDMDYPGQYLRRLKSVSLTIPCVTGPYTSINCTLTLLAHKVRTDPDAGGSYPENPGNDSRFRYTFAATQSIATSHAQNDSGVFELSFRDERYLPFETAGAISRWLISMPPQCNAFDFGTITDVVFRLNYTARDGGDLLRQKAFAAAAFPAGPKQSAPSPVGLPAAQPNLDRLFSARHEFPTDWYGLLHPAGSSAAYGQLPLWLTMDRFPFQYRGRKIALAGFDFYLTFKAASQPNVASFALFLTAPTGPPPPPGVTPAAPVPDPQADLVTLSPDPLLAGVLHGAKAASGSTAVPNYWWLSAKAADLAPIADQIDDIIVICHYSVM